MILNNYVVILCEKGGIEVRLARINDQPTKQDARQMAEKCFPGWNVKSVQMLYKSDFESEEDLW